MTRIQEFIRDENGATAMEYGIAALLISVVAIMSMGQTGEEVNNLYTDVEGAVGTVADNQ
ncbi:MAG: Flp family type IVb pilin [Rhizobiaceae bacterium]|nr:Flp family type IVb pilin [Hyphomicrobiales bacterium]NRB29842.1 Flp family type IVb pilin [Rhizobiaceae bacterium]